MRSAKLRAQKGTLAMPIPLFARKLATRLWIRRSAFPILSAPIPTRYEGGWFLCHPDILGYRLLLNRPFENHERQFAVRSFAALERGLIVDIGAHQGLYSLIAARHAPRSDVIAFEPVSSEASRLETNVKWNRYSNVSVIRTALAQTPSTALFYHCLDGMGPHSSLVHPADDVSARVTTFAVPVRTLDDSLSHHALPLRFMKLDVEGAELPVLQGALQRIRSDHPTILVEVSQLRTSPWGYNADSILSLLRSLHYHLWYCGPGGRLVPYPTAPSHRPTNVVATPPSH